MIGYDQWMTPVDFEVSRSKVKVTGDLKFKNGYDSVTREHLDQIIQTFIQLMNIFQEVNPIYFLSVSSVKLFQKVCFERYIFSNFAGSRKRWGAYMLLHCLFYLISFNAVIL